MIETPGTSSRSEKRRVLITGVGAITCVGSGGENLWAGILAERTGIRALQRFDSAPFHAKSAGEVNDFDPLKFFDARRVRRMDRHSQFSLACATLAIKDSGLILESGKSEPRRGIYMGTALGGFSDAEAQHGLFLKSGIKGIHPLLALQIYGGASSGNMSIEFGFTGPCLTSSNSCASGNIAIGEAFHLIREGVAEVMLAGAAESPLSPLTFGAFDVLKTMSGIKRPEDACRPFDADRDGFVMAEGAGVLVLESEEHARARGARVYGEVLGFAANSDAYHMTGSHPSGDRAAACMLEAIRDAGLPPEAIDYINAHGSSTPMNDKNETTAIKRAFAAHAVRLAISGTKAYHGHALGASAAIEAVLCALALQKQYVPPTLNYQTRDSECDLDYVPNHGRPMGLNYVLSNAFGFGGVNSSLVFGKSLAR